MRALVLAALPLALAACNQNTSAGADREAEVAPPPTAAPRAGAAEALSGIATQAIAVETLTDADLAALGQDAGSCRIVLTEVGKPSLAYEDGVRATIKLNGKLITLPGSGSGEYADAGLRVALREVPGEGDAGLPEEEMIVVLPGAKDELGYRGYRQCSADEAPDRSG
ncbi:hypothetical protein N0B51_11570 [Tsuneonella sp. YG55]|uniref:DUF6692 domain-containing protein n=1 Tax=Tsuneonella litorea TaxID=2976475 RepID=A0A9X2W2W9_9SPHN|nr:DUF6692 family protein [Tsuneonella litorea]MCT2559618.1 hypothetical protein [Tsuneonella litorea]